MERRVRSAIGRADPRRHRSLKPIKTLTPLLPQLTNPLTLSTTPQLIHTQTHKHGKSPISTSTGLKSHTPKQGSIFSAIGRGINAIISAIANVIMTIVGAITTVSSL
ncbi:hypothetical protein PM082_020973 [Marasmius tenuissimus]|nr:hypothetical protein PM082_020973 [Marasmius tenuissimus]